MIYFLEKVLYQSAFTNARVSFEDAYLSLFPGMLRIRLSFLRIDNSGAANEKNMSPRKGTRTLSIFYYTTTYVYVYVSSYLPT